MTTTAQPLAAFGLARPPPTGVSGIVTQMRREGDRFALPTARGEALKLEPQVEGLGRDEVTDRRWLSKIARPWAVDLFSGAGGLSLGLRDAGFHVIAAADSDERAVETHAANLLGMAWQMDMSDPSDFIERLRRRGVEQVDLVAGGPPCQPFSRAGAAKLRSLVASGTRSAEDGRVSLWRSFLQVVDALEPNAVLIENVPDMARWADGDILVALMSALRERGLEPDARVLNAWEYGVPQHRARLFVVATRDLEFTWPRRRPLVTLDDAISDLPAIPPAQRNHCLPYHGQPSTAFQARARRGLLGQEVAVVRDHCSRDVRSDDAEAFALLPQGGTYADLPDRLRRYRSDIFDDKYKRLSWNEVSRTITAHIAKDGYWYIHPDQNRTLSIREAARIQTFPDRFQFAGHPTVRYRQIGNAVPPALAKAVGRRVLVALERPRRSTVAAVSGSPRNWSGVEASVEPWLLSQDPWIVLAGELALRRARRDLAARALAILCDLGGTPAAAASSGPALVDRLSAVGLLRSRADTIVDVARAIDQQFGGHVPADDAALMLLPKVGANVASVVRCFGWGQKVIFLDHATKRLAARISGRDCSSAWTTRLELYKLADSEGPDRQFNLALRAITATCCVAGEPRCSECPLATACRSRRLVAKTNSLPVGG